MTGLRCFEKTIHAYICRISPGRKTWNRSQYGVASLSTQTFSATRSRDTRVIRSPRPELNIPEVAFTEFMFKRFTGFNNLTAMYEPSTGRSYTFNDIIDAAIRVASALTKMGIKKGDRILLFATNCPEYTILFLACGAMGAVISTANPAFKPGELKRQLEHSKCTTVVSLAEFIGTVEDAINSSGILKLSIKNIIVIGQRDGYMPFSVLLDDDRSAFPDNADIHPDDLIAIPYSSGTTGLPKGVMLSHRNIVSNMMQCMNLLSLVPGRDRLLGILPLYHIYGMVASQFCTTAMGCTYVPVSGFVPEDFLRIIESYKITSMHIVPPLALFLAKDPRVSKYDLTSLHRIICAAAPLGKSLSEEFVNRITCGITQAYGLTETSPVLTVDDPPADLGSVGALIHNTEAKVVDVESGKTLPMEEHGELCFRGPQVMMGYLDNQKATDDMIKDGWLHSGDIGTFSENGNLTVTDRLKELIKYKGFQVPPAELEAVLLSHKSVQDAAVLGIPDQQAGEVPRAFVVLKPGQDQTPEQIADFVKERVSSYKQLRGGVILTDSIPKTASGKILRRKLKDS